MTTTTATYTAYEFVADRLIDSGLSVVEAAELRLTRNGDQYRFIRARDRHGRFNGFMQLQTLSGSRYGDGRWHDVYTGCSGRRRLAYVSAGSAEAALAALAPDILTSEWDDNLSFQTDEAFAAERAAWAAEARS